MSLTGLPDLGIPALVGATRLWYPYGTGSFTVLPGGLALGRRADGSPDLSLALVRGAEANRPPDPYAVVDLRFTPTYSFDEALSEAREHRPDATVQPFTISGGYLRLAGQTPASALPAPLAGPAPVFSDGLDRARFTLTVPLEAGLFLRDLLASGTVAVSAHAEVEYPAVAARLHAEVSFDPGALLPAVTAAAGAEGEVAYGDLLQLLASGLPTLPLQVEADAGVDPAVLAATLVDWFRARYAAFAPAPAAGPQTYLRFPLEQQPGQVAWDLSQPILTTRPVVLNFDPLAGIAGWVTAHGLDALVTESTVPALHDGELTVTVSAGLPPVRLGVLELGVDLIAPPWLPWRPQQATAHAELSPPGDAATMHLRLSPAEPPVFASMPYAVLTGSAADEPLPGSRTPRSGTVVRLGPDDFPVTFFPVRVADDVITACTVHVDFVPGDPALPTQSADLDASQPTVAFTQPAPVTGGQLSIQFRPRDGAPPISLAPREAAPTMLTLASLPTYGSQQITVSATFPDPGGMVAVDLRAEGRPDDPAWVSTILLSPDQPARIWHYLPVSPFYAGYQWRQYRNTPPLAPWSQALPAGTPLAVVPDPPVEPATPAGPSAAPSVPAGLPPTDSAATNDAARASDLPVTREARTADVPDHGGS
jgi:hypothetical protein